MVKSVALGDLLPDKLDSVADRVRDRMCDDKEIKGMKLAWGYIGNELNKALKSALDCDMLEVMGKSWAGFGELTAFGDPAKHPPGERSVVELGQHDLKRELHPVIAVTIAPCPPVELKFLLELSANVSGVRLSILDGHITGGDLGELWASAQLSYEGTPLHSPQESAKLGVPGKFSFDAPGIKIPRITGAPVEGAAAGG